MPPLVSILIPLYNHEHFIAKCLDSVLEDTYPDKEIVIIDDGSKDSSAEVVRQWRSAQSESLPCSFTFISRENRGVTSTLNELVAMAQGGFLAILASDDYLLPGGIEARTNYLEQNREKLAVIGDCKLVDYQGELSGKSGLTDLHGGKKSHLIDRRLLPYEMVLNWCVPGPVFMARKELYALVGGYDVNIAVEDWDFYLRLVSRDLLGFVDFPVAAYRVRPDEASTGYTVQQHIRFNEAMLRTVANNLAAFKGIKRVYLFFEKLKYHGILERLRKRNSVNAFLARKAGRVMAVILKGCYGLWASSVVAVSRKR